MEGISEAGTKYGVRHKVKPKIECSLGSTHKMTSSQLVSSDIFQKSMILSAAVTAHAAIDAEPLMREVLSVLAELSHGGRWIALVAPPNTPYVATLLAYNIDLKRVLLVHPRDDDKAFVTIERALRAGTCGAVVAWTQLLGGDSLRRLRQAAVQGQAFGVLLHQRESENASFELPLQMTLGLEIESRVQ